MQPDSSGSRTQRSRDDFSARVRRFVAGQVGHRCSNPQCRAPTNGPGTEKGKLIDVGVAAHITAAASGGPRFDPSLTVDERKDERNAIWLCQTCAKLIDSDTSLYTRPLLEEWKAKAVALAARAVATRNVDPDGGSGFAREELHRAASTVLQVAFRMRLLILEGVDLAEHVRQVRRLPADQGNAVVRAVARWYENVAKILDESEAAMLLVRVYWPNHCALGLVELHVRLATWRNWFGENVAIALGQKLRHDREPQDPWSWDKIFGGEAMERQVMTAQIDVDLQHVESWTRPHILSRAE